MRIFVPKETAPGEKRASVVPETAKKLAALGAEVAVETRIGASIYRSDTEYKNTGASVVDDRMAGLREADVVLRLRKPPIEEVAPLREGSVHISFLDAFNERDLIEQFAAAKVSAISMEMIPRTSIAQKMDALSSQRSLAGYLAVILAAEELDRIFPMMITPAGTIQPARVFVIGVGVAGLQAIATAKRLGARVEAFDTRPAVEEQVRSLGARFVKVELGETGQTEQGYAKALTEEQLAAQRDVMAKHCSLSDVVVTTAQVFGQKAPLLVTTKMVEQMRPGSVVFDLAVEAGGNVECAALDKVVEVNGVRVFGYANMPSRAPTPASEMYSNNLGNFVEHLWNKERNSMVIDAADELLRGCLITHGGEVVNETIKAHYHL
ncbi:MAG: Re/Si-specific NAD(P)(+) transhydrogenase subunit alpha [Verrucomicrobia bacterium]|nr:MAG: Re/Si-specific NAD(P)(+) transhydrogenase subunit alpha [Verrucomicrobiota bacterium]